MGMFPMFRKYPQYILALLVIIVYGRSLGNDFVWDDKIFLLGNHAYQYFDLYKILESCANSVEYLPVRDLTYAIDYSLWGENAAGFHLTNLLLAILVSSAAYRFTSRLINTVFPDITDDISDASPFFIVAMFILHPLQVQTVNLLTCRNVLLAGLFSFVSLDCFLLLNQLEWKKYRFLFLSMLMFVAALLSKANVITLPLVMLLLTLYLPQIYRMKNLMFSAVMLLISGSAYYFFKLIATANRAINLDAVIFGSFDYIVSIVRAVQISMFYIGKSLFPVGLSPQYEVLFSVSLLSSRFLFALILVTIITLIAVKSSNNRLLSFGWFFFLIMLLPVSNIYPTYPPVADRYVFMPLYGLVLMFTAALCSAYRSALVRRPLLVLMMVLVASSMFSFILTPIYSDEEKLWQRVLQLNPNDSRALVNLGSSNFTQFKYDEAFADFKEASKIDPSKPNYDYSKGLLLFRKARIDEADALFKNAIERDGSHLQSLYYSALCALRRGDATNSARIFRDMDESTNPDVFGYLKKRDMMLGVFVAPRLKNEFEAVMSKLGNSPEDCNLIFKKNYLLFVTRNYQQVVDGYLQSVAGERCFSGKMASMIGISYRQTGDDDSAISFLKMAMESTEPDMSASIPLSRLLVAEKRYIEAEDILKRASDSGIAKAAAEMASLQFRLGRRTETDQWIKTANRLDPSLKNRMSALSIKLADIK